MSKKTFFKRVAIAAIAALGFGMLATTPSVATVSGHTLTVDNAADAVNVGDTATAVFTHRFFEDVNNDSVTVRARLISGNPNAFTAIRLQISDSSTNVSTADPLYCTVGAAADCSTVSSGDGAIVLERTDDTGDGADRAVLGWNDTRNPDSYTVSGGSGTGSVISSSITARLVGVNATGTFVVRVSTTELNASAVGGVSTATSGPYVDWTITVSAVSTKPDGTSVSVLRNGTAAYADGTAAGDSATLGSIDDSDVAPSFTIWTLLNNTLGTSGADNAIDSLTVTATGQAYVSTSSTVMGASRTLTLTSDAAPDATGTPVYVWSTGTAGTATITVSAIEAGLSWTKNVTFYGDVAKLEVTTSRYKIARTGGNATSSMFSVTATDAAGTKVPGLTLSVISSDYAQIASGSCADEVGLATDGVYACGLTSAAQSTSGGKATATVRILDPGRATGTTSYLTTTYDVTLGGSVKTVVLSTDKATYEPGEKMVVTATAKDASGNPVFDGATGPTLSSNKSLGGSLTMNVYVGGVSTSQTRSSTTGLVSTADTLYAPAASGKFRITGLDGDALPISVEATVGDDAATAAAAAATDAALEAIDAANAATDAANLAAEAADAATVAAEEARDAADAATAAVEALATEVATLMAALKAQITTLANTVAKIAKKVKA
jgi:hypothetical protein